MLKTQSYKSAGTERLALCPLNCFKAALSKADPQKHRRKLRRITLQPLAALEDDDTSKAPSLTDQITTEPGPNNSLPASEPPYQLIAGLAGIGALLTAYLTIEKVRGGDVACPASGSCETILSSGYASVFGIPLSLFGLLAYSSVTGLTTWQSSRSKERRPNLGRIGTLAGGAVLAATSSSLLYILATQFPGQTCTWCIGSAFLSFSIFIAAVTGFSLRELTGLAAPGGLTIAGTVLFLSIAWSGVEAPQAMADIDIPYQATTVRGPSPPRAVEIAQRLKEAGAKMYGAFWCSHCQEQKVAFGAEAQNDLPYVECFPQGFRNGVTMEQQCKDVNVEGFPLWIINGKRYDGALTFDRLEKALATTSN